MITWIIEKEVNEAAERVAQAAKETGCKVIRWESGRQVPNVHTPCVFLGSLNAYALPMPGLVGEPERLRYRSYLPYVADTVLNQDIYSGTVGNIPEVPWERVFVRPDSPLKPFSGRVLDKKDLRPENLDYGFYYEDLDLPIVLSPAQEIGQEWRFVAVNRELVSCSTYTAAREASMGPLPPSGAMRVARKAAMLSPEPTVVIDICQTGDGSFKLVEFNLFSGADLYNNNATVIVLAVNTWKS